MQSDTEKSQNSIGFLLLPGAGLGSWIWEEVAAKLQYPSVGVDFPKEPSAGMKEYTAAALEQSKNLPTDKIIVVGHSLGGVAALRVAEALGDKLAGFVGIAAAIPKNKGSFVSSLPFPQKLVMPLIIRLAGTKPSDEAIKKSYCNDLDEAKTNEVIARYTSEPKQVYFDTSAAAPEVPKLYIKTTKDVDFVAAVQDAMIANLGAQQVATIDSGHLPMLAKPDKLAEVLNNFAQSS